MRKSNNIRWFFMARPYGILIVLLALQVWFFSVGAANKKVRPKTSRPAARLSAVFSPVLTPRRGPCEPGCNACNRVCPTGAIASLSLLEKQKAKVGTARIFRQKCLAWELEKKCLICDEVCPFDAIEFRKLTGNPIAVPFVNENKCAGCGFCEHYCPVRATPAIVVEPMLALRLSEGSYRAVARERGYVFELGQKAVRGASTYDGPEKLEQNQLGEDDLPPGFTE